MPTRRGSTFTAKDPHLSSEMRGIWDLLQNLKIGERELDPELLSKIGNLVRNSRKSKRQLASLRPVISPMQFGATGNGVTPDFTAFKDCFAAAEAAPGTDVYIPPPNVKYSITGSLELPTLDCHIFGAHSHIHQETDNSVTFEIPDGSKRIKVSGLYFTNTGSYASPPDVGGRSVIDTSQSTSVDGCEEIEIFENEIEADSLTGISTWEVRGLFIHHNIIRIGNGEHGIYAVCPIDEMSRTEIYSNKVTGPGTASSAGITLRNCHRASVYRNEIDDLPSGITANGQPWLVEDIADCDIVDNYIHDCATAIGVSGTDHAFRCRISRNRVKTMTSHGIIVDAGYHEIHDNYFEDMSDASFYPIKSTAGDHSVQGNQFIDVKNCVQTTNAGASFIVANNRGTGLTGGNTLHDGGNTPGVVANNAYSGF